MVMKLVEDEMLFKSNFDLEKINSLFSNLSSLTMFELLDLKKNYKILNYSSYRYSLSYVQDFLLSNLFNLNNYFFCDNYV